MYCKERRTGKHDESILSLIFPNDLLFPSPTSLILFICCPLLSNSVILCYSPMLVSYVILSYPLWTSPLSSHLSSPLLSSSFLCSILSSSLLSSPLLLLASIFLKTLSHQQHEAVMEVMTWTPSHQLWSCCLTRYWMSCSSPSSDCANISLKKETVSHIV